MDRIELFPSLSRCIETTAREEFWNSVNQYIEGGCQVRQLEDRIELLRTFVESADLKKFVARVNSTWCKGRKLNS